MALLSRLFGPEAPMHNTQKEQSAQKNTEHEQRISQPHISEEKVGYRIYDLIRDKKKLTKYDQAVFDTIVLFFEAEKGNDNNTKKRIQQYIKNNTSYIYGTTEYGTDIISLAVRALLEPTGLLDIPVDTSHPIPTKTAPEENPEIKTQQPHTIEKIPEVTIENTPHYTNQPTQKVASPVLIQNPEPQTKTPSDTLQSPTLQSEELTAILNATKNPVERINVVSQLFSSENSAVIDIINEPNGDVKILKLKALERIITKQPESALTKRVHEDIQHIIMLITECTTNRHNPEKIHGWEELKTIWPTKYAEMKEAVLPYEELEKPSEHINPFIVLTPGYDEHTFIQAALHDVASLKNMMQKKHEELEKNLEPHDTRRKKIEDIHIFLTEKIVSIIKNPTHNTGEQRNKEQEDTSSEIEKAKEVFAYKKTHIRILGPKQDIQGRYTENAEIKMQLEQAEMIALGDAHASVLKILETAIMAGLITMPEKEATLFQQEYATLLSLGRQMGIITQTEFKTQEQKVIKALEAVRWSGEQRQYVLIGDTINDRGLSDKLVMKLIEKIRATGGNITILASNHDLDVVIEYISMLEPTIPPKTIIPTQKLSRYRSYEYKNAEEMRKNIEQEYLSYIKNQKLLLYNEENKTLFSHALITQEQIKTIRNHIRFTEEITEHNIKEFIRQVNNWYSTTIENLGDHTKPLSERIDIASIELIRTVVWSRNEPRIMATQGGYASQTELPLFGIAQRFVHGHDQYADTASPYNIVQEDNYQGDTTEYRIINIDTDVRKGLNNETYEPEETVIYAV